MDEKFREWRLFLVTWLIRVLVLVLIVVFYGEPGLILGDGIQYIALARSLVEGEGFTWQGKPFFFRTIGYPLLTAGGLVLFRSLVGFLFFQTIVASFTPLLVLRLGERLNLGKKVIWVAAWITALEPHMVYYSAVLMTESMFTLALLLALVYIFKAIESQTVKDSFIAGLGFGIGMLIKPLLQLFPLALFMLFLPWFRNIQWKTVLKHAFVVLATVFIIVFPWMYRNYRLFGSWAMSYQGPSAAWSYLGTSIVSVRDKISYQDAEKKLVAAFHEKYGSSLSGGEEQKAFGREALHYIQENPFILARLIVINTVSFWTSNNYNGFLNYYRLIPRIDHSVLPPTHYLAQGRIGDLVVSFWKIFSQPFYIVGVVGRVFWVAATFLFIYGLWAAYRAIPERRFQLLFLVSLCLYITALMWVEGLGIEGRLRHMIMPLEFLYGTYGGFVLWRKLNERKVA